MFAKNWLGHLDALNYKRKVFIQSFHWKKIVLHNCSTSCCLFPRCHCLPKEYIWESFRSTAFRRGPTVRAATETASTENLTIRSDSAISCQTTGKISPTTVCKRGLCSSLRTSSKVYLSSLGLTHQFAFTGQLAREKNLAHTAVVSWRKLRQNKNIPFVCKSEFWKRWCPFTAAARPTETLTPGLFCSARTAIVKIKMSGGHFTRIPAAVPVGMPGHAAAVNNSSCQLDFRILQEALISEMS